MSLLNLAPCRPYVLIVLRQDASKVAERLDFLQHFPFDVEQLPEGQGRHDGRVPLCSPLYPRLTHLQVDVSGVFRIALHCAPLASWVVSFPPDLNGVLRVQIPEVPAQQVCTAKFPRAPWKRALDRHLGPHPLCFIADARALLQQAFGRTTCW